MALKFVLVIILLVSTTRCKEEFHCKVRPGCHMVRCDPMSVNCLANMKRDEYPITCIKPGGEEKPDALSPDVAISLVNDLALLRDEMASLKRRNNDLESEMASLKRRNNDLESELKTKTLELQSKITENDAKHKQRLKKTETRLKEEIKILLESQNNSRGIRPLDTSPVLPSRSDRARLNINPTIPPPCSDDGDNEDIASTLPIHDSCKTNEKGGCLWLAVVGYQSVNYEEAVKVCEKYGSLVAIIPSSGTYQGILEYGRSITRFSGLNIDLWVAMNVVFSKYAYSFTRSGLDPYDAFYVWKDENWVKNSENRYFKSNAETHVYISFQKDPKAKHGMVNAPPALKRHGAVCWKPHKF